MFQRYINFMIGSLSAVTGLTGAGSKILKDPPQK